MRDIVEHLEAQAEADYFDMIQPDGRLKCGCGRLFDAEDEGGSITSNPYTMPVCGECFDKWMKENQK